MPAAAPARWRILAILSAAELLGMSLWFTGSAAAPHFQLAWSLSDQQTSWLTAAVQLGFVAGTAAAALLNLADILPSRAYFTASAVLGATVNAMILAAPGFASVLALRFLTGVCLAGVYPPAMKMIATWFQSSRGLAIGTVVGALTLGKATPYLTRAYSGDVRPIVLIASAGALIAAALVGWGYREGPFPFPRRPFSWSLVGAVARHRPTRLAIGGYLGHMWELYAMWTLVAIFFHELFARRGHTDVAALSYAGLVGFAVIGIGAIGSVIAGAWADRLGRERITIGAMLVSGGCALVIGWLGAAPVWLVVSVALVWGFAIVADSAQFSALVTEVTPVHAVGTALTLQTSVGFLLTAGSIWFTVEVASRFGWGAAFTLLAIGPALGIVAMVRLRDLRALVARA